MIAIRAGQTSAVEFLVQHGASVDGGNSHAKLTAADGRAPAGAREKMMARRCGWAMCYAVILSHAGKELEMKVHRGTPPMS